MNIQTDDECKTKFDEIKFRKIDARYVVYQIVDEKIVSIPSFRLYKESELKIRHGSNS